MPKKIDLTGKRFGRLTVVEEAPRYHTSGGVPVVMWFCDCDCGTKHISVNGNLLRQGDTVSCGCWNREKAKFSKFKQRTTYDLSGNYGVGHTAKGDEFWFDKEDYELISKYNWYKHHNYFEAHIPMSKPRRSINMHRLVMGISDKKYDFTTDVDHIITENKFDNRKCNLRIVTKLQNNRNHKIQKNNTSGYTGVYYSKSHQTWRTTIGINGKRKQFDCKNKESAIKLRKELEDKYYGEYTYDNSQKNFKEVFR